MAQDIPGLPIEIIRNIVLGSVRRNQSAALLLSRTCKAIRAWVTPVLYSTVVLTTKAEFFAFERALYSAEVSFDTQRGSPSGLEFPLGTYVQNLWLGQTRSRYGQHRVTATTGDVAMLRGDSGQGRDIWDLTMSIISMCPSIRNLALVNFPPAVLQLLLLRLPASLESLSIRLGGRHAQLDVPDLSRLTSLRSLTFLHTHIGVNSLVHMLQLPGLRTFTRLCDRCSESLPYAWPQRHARTYLEDSMSQLMYLSRASEAFERLTIVSLVDCDLPLEQRLAQLEALMVQYGVSGLPSSERVAVRAKDARDEFGDVDGLKTLYDDWVAGLDLCSVGCVQYTQEHSFWDINAWRLVGSIRAKAS